MAVLNPTPEELQSISIGEARKSIKAKFTSYRQLLDEKESELLSELDQLEESNKPELTQVRQDLNQLEEVLKSLDQSLGANTLKLFLEEQRILLNNQISHFQISERLLSHVKFQLPDIESTVKNAIKVVPFWSKAKFRTELEPLLNLKPKLGEDWYIVSTTWFNTFNDSINLTKPQPNDSWEFPTKIPIPTADKPEAGLALGSPKVLHSKAWNILLEFSGLSLGSIPIKRQSYQNGVTNQIEVPVQATKHKCIIGHNDGNSKFSFDCEIGIFPYETYGDVIEKISGFSSLFTKYSPILYTFANTDTITCNTPQYTQYTIGKSQPQSQQRSQGIYSQMSTTSVYQQPAVRQQVPVKTNSFVGVTDKILIIIPNSIGNNTFQVLTN